MINSKALKDSFRCGCPPGQDPKNGFFKRVIEAIKNLFLYHVFYPLENIFQRYVERIGRSIAFARQGWLSYDFDGCTLYDLMQFKLKRIKKTLIDGSAVQEDADMKALQQCIKLTGRLFRGCYDEYYHKLHDKKWGPMPDWDTEPHKADENGNVLYSRILFKDRPNVKSPEDKLQERKEFMECYEKGEINRLKDLDTLNSLFKSHIAFWWD